MNRSHRLASAALLVLLAQVTACQPDPAPAPDDTPPEQPTGGSSEQPTGNTPPVQTFPYSLTAAPLDPGTSTGQLPDGTVYGLLTASSLASMDFRYDAYVLTARESGQVIIKAEVIESSSKSYPYGYGYPLSVAAIEDGVSLTAYGGRYIQDALNTGTAAMEYPVEAGRQYLLVYKTFNAFTPLTYRLGLPDSLTVEGRIYPPPEPVPVVPGSAGPITLENPRPDALSRFVSWLGSRVSGS